MRKLGPELRTRFFVTLDRAYRPAGLAVRHAPNIDPDYVGGRGFTGGCTLPYSKWASGQGGALTR